LRVDYAKFPYSAGVFRLDRARPNGSVFEVGTQFHSFYQAQFSGVFKDKQLILRMPLEQCHPDPDILKFISDELPGVVG